MNEPPDVTTPRGLAAASGTTGKETQVNATTRCMACGDPAPYGWHACRKCHAWDDILSAVGPEGADLNRLHRGLAHLRQRDRRGRESVRALLEKLQRRVAELEAMHG